MLQQRAGEAGAQIPPDLLLAGDASESTYAAHTPHGVLSVPIIIPFSDQDMERMRNKTFSSTLR